MNFALLKLTIENVSDRAARDRALMPELVEKKTSLDEGKKKKKRRKYNSVFPILYPRGFSTPKTQTPYAPQTGEFGKPPVGGTTGGGGTGGSGGGGGAGGGGTGGTGGGTGGMTTSWAPSSRVKVLHELKKALGLLEFSGGTGAAAVTWTGFAVPNPLMVKTRGGGPTIGGPGFASDPDQPTGGVYHPPQSPGIGFRTEKGWRIWKAAQEIIAQHPELPQSAIVQAAVAKAGVKIGEIDPAEMRLIEMGVEWYLTDPGALAAKRGSGGEGGAGPTQTGSMGRGGDGTV